MLNLPDNLRPKEIERELREHQKSHKLPPYFTSRCMDALATSKDGYIVYSTAEHSAGRTAPFPPPARSTLPTVWRLRTPSTGRSRDLVSCWLT